MNQKPVCPACYNRPLGRVCETCDTLWIAPQDEDDRPRWRASLWLQGIQPSAAGEIDVKRRPYKI